MTSPSERFTNLFERTNTALLAYAVRRVSDPARPLMSWARRS